MTNGTPSTRLTLHGRRALVTGSSGGIGSAVAAGLHEAGATVGGLDLVAPLGDGPCEKSYVCDVSDPSAVSAAVTSWAALGGLDLLVVAAGRFPNKPLERWSLEEFRALWDVNVGGAFNVVKAALPFLRRSAAGRIIVVSSSAVHQSVPGFAPYGATKAALIGFVRSLAAEVAEDAVTANVITPGLTATEAALTGDVAGFFDHVVAGQLVKRRLAAADLVGAVLYLSSDSAAMVTAQVINIDGGAVTY